MTDTPEQLEAMRRLGRDWIQPTDRFFIADYLAGRLYDCIDCGELIACHACWMRPPYVCERCADARALAEDNREYDVVLVEEEYGYRYRGRHSWSAMAVVLTTYWAWYPDPAGMCNLDIESFWSIIPHFRCTDFLPDKLGGEWYQLGHEGFRAEYEAQVENHRLRHAHIHEDDDSVLTLVGYDDNIRGYRYHRVYHAGYPRRRRR